MKTNLNQSAKKFQQSASDILNIPGNPDILFLSAELPQLVEGRTRNADVNGSIPLFGYEMFFGSLLLFFPFRHIASGCIHGKNTGRRRGDPQPLKIMVVW